jgi:hypothetical protein
MAELARFYSEKLQTEGTVCELVKSYQCPRCEGARFSYLITIRPGDQASKEYASVSVSLTCLSCKRLSIVHPVITAGTVFWLSGGDGTGFNASLCKPSLRAIQNARRKTSTAPKSNRKKPGKRKATSSSQTRKVGKRK